MQTMRFLKDYHLVIKMAKTKTHMALPRNQYHANHAFSERLSSCDENGQDKVAQKYKEKVFQLFLTLSSCDENGQDKDAQKQKEKSLPIVSHISV